jgi:hypothetical protein
MHLLDAETPCYVEIDLYFAVKISSVCDAPSIFIPHESHHQDIFSNLGGIGGTDASSD